MRNELLRLFGMLIIGVVVLSATQEALALSNNEKIALAKSAAPDFISKNATVLDEDGKLLSQGNNDWVCSPGLPPKYENPMCNDPVWQALMKALNAKNHLARIR